jgi:hypothetical protein
VGGLSPGGDVLTLDAIDAWPWWSDAVILGVLGLLVFVASDRFARWLERP